MKTPMSFKGKTVLVTGGTRGLGAAMRDTFAGLGARVIYTGTALCGKSKAGIVYWHLDLADERSTAAFISRMRALKQLDGLVNNAGINILGSIDRIQKDDWDKVLQVNLTGAMLLMKEAALLMKKNKSGGRILNVSSIFGLTSRQQRNAYSATKAGLIGLTRAAALDMAPHGILINAICPGFVLTDLTKRMLSVRERARLVGTIPMGRFGKEAEIAWAAVFLCSSLNTYMTGQTMVVDGGVNIQ